jgi:hypothetical protein
MLYSLTKINSPTLINAFNKKKRKKGKENRMKENLCGRKTYKYVMANALLAYYF